MKPLLFLMIFISCLLFTSCNHSDSNTNEKTSETFCLTDSMQKMISIDSVRFGTVESEISLAGKIQAIPSKNIRLFPLISGVVKNVFIELGDYVNEGQPLVEIISSEVAEFEKELTDAEANLQIAKKNLMVAKDMYDSKLISEKEFVVAQKEVEKSEAEVKRLKAIFSIYHITETGTYILKSPISGYIVSKNISQGMQIRSDAQDELMSIADIKQLWVVANVYESDMSKIKLGQKAYIETIAYPDSVIEGKIDKIFEMLDPITRTMKIAIQIENKNYLLKPEMYARVKIHFNEDFSLPYVLSDAVIFDNGKYYLVKYQDKCNIQIKPIDIYRKVGKKIYLKNTSPKEKIITKNNLLVFDAILDQ